MSDIFTTIIINIIPLFLAIVVHEISHGIVAYWLGDDTAQKAGRFKLLTHFDIFGSFIIPLSLYLMNSPFLIGYAKPVPINPQKFKDPLNDMALVAIAGPVSNLLMALLSAFVLKNIYINCPEIVVQIIMSFIVINLALLFFNLIPIPPLDGSRLLAAVMPKNYVEKFYRLEPFGIIVVILLEFLTNQISQLTGCQIGFFYTFIQRPVTGMLKFLLS